MGTGVRLRAKEIGEDVVAPVSAVGAQRATGQEIVKRATARECAVPKRVRGELPQVAPARRTKMARLRSFDDWSNWFWRRDWPESVV